VPDFDVPEDGVVVELLPELEGVVVELLPELEGEVVDLLPELEGVVVELLPEPDVPLVSEPLELGLEPLIPELPDVLPDEVPLLGEVPPLPYDGLAPVPVVPAAPLVPVLSFVDLAACFFLLLRFACLVVLVEDVPEVSVALFPCWAWISCACFSTAAALAGSVLVVTPPLEDVCANAAPAIEKREINKAWDIFIVVSP